MSERRNFCDFYSSIVPHHRKLKLKCKRLMSAIQDEQDRRTEKRKEIFRLNLQQFIKDVITKMNERMELFRMMSFDLAIELLDYKAHFKTLEDDNCLQHSTADSLNKTLESLEQSTNVQVHKTRQEFMKNYKNLMNAKFQFESMEKELNEKCQKQMKIEKELAMMKDQMKKTLCIIKKLRDANEPSTVEISEFKILRAGCENLSLKLAHLNSTINCLYDKMYRMQSESDLIRQVFQSKMRVIKEYDEWSREGLMKKKNVLQNYINMQGPQTSSGDSKIRKLQQQIILVQQQIEKSEECMDHLVKTFDEIQVWKRPCDPTPMSKHLLLHKKAPIMAVDYMGSKFVHLE